MSYDLGLRELDASLGQSPRLRVFSFRFGV